MPTPDIDNKGDSDQFDFLDDDAANNPARKKKVRRSKELVMPIIRKPVPISESGPARVGAVQDVATFEDDFDFLGDEKHGVKSDASVSEPAWNEGLHDRYDDDDDRKSPLVRNLLLLSLGAIVLGGLVTAINWYQKPNVDSQAAVPATTQVPDTLTAESDTSISTSISTSTTKTLSQRFTEQLQAIEAQVAAGELDAAEETIATMDRSVYGYGAPEFTVIEQQINDLRNGIVGGSEGTESVAEAGELVAAEAERLRLAEEQRLAEVAREERAAIAQALEQEEAAKLAEAEAEAERLRLAEEQRLAEVAREEQAAIAQAQALEQEEAAKLAEAEAERLRLAEEQRLAEVAREEQAALARAQALEQEEAAKLAEAEAARLIEAERVRLGEAEAARVAEAERVRLAEAEAARVAEAERVRLAEAEAARVAEAERVRLAEAEAVAAQEAQRLAAQKQVEEKRIQDAAVAEAARVARAAEVAAAALAAEQRAAAAESLALATAKAEERLERDRIAKLETDRRIAERARLNEERARAAEFTRQQAAAQAQAQQERRLRQRQAAAAEEQLALSQAQERLQITPKQENYSITDNDFNFVGGKFVELKAAIESRNIANVIALTQRSGRRVQQMLQLFENNSAIKARLVNVASRNTEGVIVGELAIQKLVKNSGAEVDAPANLSSITLTSRRGPAGWSTIAW